MSVNAEKEDKAARRRQYFASFVVALSAFNFGVVVGFSSPTAFQMRAQLNASSHAQTTSCPLQEIDNLTSWQISLFIAVFSLGGMVGGLAWGRLMDRLGRKPALIASYLCALLGWTLISLGQSFAVLLIGRILTGVFGGICGGVANAYVGEISSKDRRGILGSFYELKLTTGILLTLIAGALMPWQRLAIVAAALVIVSPTPLVFVRESPHFLLMKDKEEEARNALLYFRGAGYDVDQEIANIKASQQDAKEKSFTLRDLKKAHIYKPLIITGVTGIMFHGSGIGMVTANLATIAQSAKVDLSENIYSTLIIGIELLATIASIFLIEKIGRKTLLVFSGAAMAVSYGVLGLYFYMLAKHEVWTKQHMSWLPLTALGTYMIAFGVGYGPIVWILIGEMFPPEVRNTAAGLTVTLMSLTAFVTICSYYFLNRTMGSYGLFFLYGAFNATAAVFTASYMKETQGKSLEEITAMFKQKKNTESVPENEALRSSGTNKAASSIFL